MKVSGGAHSLEENLQDAGNQRDRSQDIYETKQTQMMLHRTRGTQAQILRLINLQKKASREFGAKNYRLNKF